MLIDFQKNSFTVTLGRKLVNVVTSTSTISDLRAPKS